MRGVRVEVDSASYTYADGTDALHSVGFVLEPGESVGLVGPNGSGKSTLLSLLNGLLAPTAGQVRVGGTVVQSSTLSEIRRSVGLVFQDPDDQLFMPTVLEDVAFGPMNLGCAPADAEARARRALDAVGSTDLLSRSPQRLSLGQRSAVAIAAVLAMDPDVLALDEPAGRLDPRARRTLISLLRGFPHTRLVASHDLDLVLDLCDRVLVLDRGRLVGDGPAPELLADGAFLRRHGLELPLGLGPAPGGTAAPSARNVPTFVWYKN
jgi:cobalt/nickel transport system ATP-binding protein